MYPFSQRPKEWTVHQCFPKAGPLWQQTPISRVLLSVFFGVPSNGALPAGSPHTAPTQRDAPFLEPSFIHLATSPVYEPPSRFHEGRWNFMATETREGHTVKLWLAASFTCLVYTQPLYIILYIYIYIYIYRETERPYLWTTQAWKEGCFVLRADLAGQHPTLGPSE